MDHLINRRADCFRNTRCKCRHSQDCTRHPEIKVREDTSDKTLATCEEIQRARDEYETTEIQIDEECAASHTDDGVWVAAWVWLSEPWKPEPKT